MNVKIPTIPQDFSKVQMFPIAQETFDLAREYNRRYLHWADLEYRDVGPESREKLWLVMKFLRSSTIKNLEIGAIDLSYNLTDDANRTLHELDMKLSFSFASESEIDSRRKMMYSVSSMMEESIASSQIEGASTTTKVAKKMLRENIPPTDKSQQMILNNYRAMQFIKEHSTEDLTPGLIKSIHAIISHGTMEDEKYEGCFRDNDTIAVRDVFEDKTYHEPPQYWALDQMVGDLCNFANDESEFIHPLVKGIILHYTLAYIHPFMDGNGRVSRSIFYWYLMKRGYPAIEFLSVSKVIKSHRGRYDMAYLLSETDDDDVTYFINYNLDMVSEATDVFMSYVQRKMRENERILGDAHAAGLSIRQRDVLSDLMHSSSAVSVHELATKYLVSDASMRRDLLRIVDLGLAVQVRDGRKTLYRFRE